MAALLHGGTPMVAVEIRGRAQGDVLHRSLWVNAIAGDFDGDGELELASGYPAGTHVLIQELDGTEKLRVEFDSPHPVGDFGDVMDAGDVDGNGIDDLSIAAPELEYGQGFFLFDPLCKREP